MLRLFFWGGTRSVRAKFLGRLKGGLDRLKERIIPPHRRYFDQNVAESVEGGHSVGCWAHVYIIFYIVCFCSFSLSGSLDAVIVLILFDMNSGD